jgi:hypothetical protein
MSKRILKDFPIVGGNTKANVLRLTLEYRIGGWNYFTGQQTARGLFISCSPLEIKKSDDGFTTIGYVGFSGTNMHVLDMKRFSQKTLDNFTPDEALVKRLVNHVINDNQLVVEGWE